MGQEHGTGTWDWNVGLDKTDLKASFWIGYAQLINSHVVPSEIMR